MSKVYELLEEVFNQGAENMGEELTSRGTWVNREEYLTKKLEELKTLVFSKEENIF